MSDFIPNSFQVPNAVIDDLMCELSGSSFMCLLFIIRKTKGWHKERDFIPISQFQKALGKGRATIFRALEELSEKGLIITQTSNGRVTEYALNPDMFTRLKNETGKEAGNPSQKWDGSEQEPVSKMRPDPSQKCDETSPKNATHQKTLSKDTIQNNGQSPKKKKRARLSDDFDLPDDWRLKALEYWKKNGRTDLDPQAEFEKFKAHHIAKGSLMERWDAAWRTWYTNALRFNRPQQQQRQNDTRGQSLQTSLTDRSWADGN